MTSIFRNYQWAIYGGYFYHLLFTIACLDGLQAPTIQIIHLCTEYRVDGELTIYDSQLPTAPLPTLNSKFKSRLPIVIRFIFRSIQILHLRIIYCGQICIHNQLER